MAVNDFEHRDFLWEVPYRTLVRTGYDNLITAGRTAAGADYAWDVLRVVIPPAIVTGQAAGLAAAQALETGRAIHKTWMCPGCKKNWKSKNVLLHFEDSWLPAPEKRPDIRTITKLDEKGGRP